MRYTIEQIKSALLLLKTTGSPRKFIEILGDPSNPMLYHWRDKYPEYYDAPVKRYWEQAFLELKRNTIKSCINGEESVKSVAEDIGYSPSLIYKWLRDYQKKGFIPSMKKTRPIYHIFLQIYHLLRIQKPLRLRCHCLSANIYDTVFIESIIG